jgi:hypothetical protein
MRACLEVSLEGFYMDFVDEHGNTGLGKSHWMTEARDGALVI